MVIEPQESICFNLPNNRIVSMHPHAWLLCGSWGSNMIKLMLSGQVYSQLSHLPSPHHMILRWKSSDSHNTLTI